jgi:hypothetical protein
MHLLCGLLTVVSTSFITLLPHQATDTAHAVIDAPASQPDSIVLRVLAINDFHGALDSRSWAWSEGRPVGGAATGGSGYTMLAGLPADDVGMLDLDALIRYLGVLRQPVQAPGDARIHRLGEPR